MGQKGFTGAGSEPWRRPRRAEVRGCAALVVAPVQHGPPRDSVADTQLLVERTALVPATASPQGIAGKLDQGSGVEPPRPGVAARHADDGRAQTIIQWYKPSILSFHTIPPHVDYFTQSVNNASQI